MSWHAKLGESKRKGNLLRRRRHQLDRESVSIEARDSCTSGTQGRISKGEGGPRVVRVHRKALTGPTQKEKKNRQQTESRLTGLMAREPGAEATLGWLDWVVPLKLIGPTWGQLAILAYFWHAIESA